MKEMNEDWVECTLGDIANIYNGNSINKQVKEEKYAQYKSGFDYIGTKDVGVDGKITYDTGVKIPFEENFKTAPKNSVLVCSEGGSAGKKTAFVDKEICFGNKLYAITNEKNLFEGKYVFYYTRFNQFFELFKNQMNGIIGGVSQRKFVEILIPLAPIIEQKAIVRKIEELFSSLDSGIADLKKAQEQLVIYRQAVLKKAFEGGLTKEWREKQTYLPSAENLLKQIKEERQKHYEKQLEDWYENINDWKNFSKPKKPIFYSEIHQDGSLPILNLGELVFQISSKLMPNQAPEFAFIGMDCLEKNALKPHFTYKFKEFKSAGNWFNTNHILYGRLRPYLNKVYQAEYEGVASGEFIILETIKYLNPNYLKLILHQQDFVHWSNNQSAGDKPRVKFDQIALYPIKVPSLQEQKKIVQEIESRLSVCDKVEESITESLEKAKALRQSILKNAFEGKLLSTAEIAKCKQDKDYEPAGVLLERIKKEKKNK